MSETTERERAAQSLEIHEEVVTLKTMADSLRKMAAKKDCMEEDTYDLLTWATFLESMHEDASETASLRERVAELERDWLEVCSAFQSLDLKTDHYVDGRRFAALKKEVVNAAERAGWQARRLLAGKEQP